ncbi:MAG: hypothetical protein M3290_03055 [Actinomycetota bacterium]|nr:hypothetical protein [Actinomycetota bacterium]
MHEARALVFGDLPAAPNPPAPPAAAPTCYQPLSLRDPQILDLFGHSGEVRDVAQVHRVLLVKPDNES